MFLTEGNKISYAEVAKMKKSVSIRYLTFIIEQGVHELITKTLEEMATKIFLHSAEINIISNRPKNIKKGEHLSNSLFTFFLLSKNVPSTFHTEAERAMDVSHTNTPTHASHTQIH